LKLSQGSHARNLKEGKMAQQIWSMYQEAIFAAVLTILSSGRDLVVLARAGTGV
jgi:hypothetical protein